KIVVLVVVVVVVIFIVLGTCRSLALPSACCRPFNIIVVVVLRGGATSAAAVVLCPTSGCKNPVDHLAVLGTPSIEQGFGAVFVQAAVESQTLAIEVC